MISKFTKLGLSEDLAKALDEMGWEEPSPIQQEAVPFGLNGYDLIAQAQTGTGKTGAFGSIIISNIPSEQQKPSAIVLAPTRELAVQVSEELNKMAAYTGHVCVAI
ncbi:MAG: DEAD/DEAH box helicase [Candidatus Methanomethylophilus sp.]|nr:DEAD/DEAH box helicase [Methanomethylophilus sp.]